MAELGRDVAFSVLGRPMRASGVPDALASWLLSRWRFEERGHPSASHPFSISIVARPGPVRPVGEGGTRHVAHVRGAEVPWTESAGRWSSGTSERGVRFSVAPRGGRIEVWGAGGAPAGPEERVALYVAISEALRASGLVPLHAAVVARDGRATALAGPSGVGKTSTLLRAVADGWSVVAEDLSWVDADTMTLYGWDRGIRLWPDALPYVEHLLPDRAWERDRDGKLFLDYAALGAPLVPAAAWVALAELSRDPLPADGVPALAPVGPRDAVRVLWEAVGVPLTPAARAVTARAVDAFLERIELVRMSIAGDALPLPPARVQDGYT